MLVKRLFKQMTRIFRTVPYDKNKVNSNREYFSDLISFLDKIKSIPLLLALIPSTLWAGEYFVIDTTDNDSNWDQDALDVCNLLTDNFNHYPDEPPMVCVRKFQPELKEITYPQWTPVDFEEFKQVLREGKAPNEFTADRYLAFIDTINLLTEQGRYFGTTWKSRFDMNSDGSIDEVYRWSFPKLKFECKDHVLVKSNRTLFLKNFHS